MKRYTMYMCISLAALALIPSGADPAPGVPYTAYLSPAVLSLVSPTGKAVSSGFDANAVPKLAPTHPLAASFREAIASEKPNILVEAVYVYKKKGWDDPAKETLALFNIARSVSTLEGIEYWSESRKAMRLFYSESYRIDSPESKKRLPDPVVMAMPKSDWFYVLQTDLTFGTNVYVWTMKSEPNAFSSESVNVTTMWYGIVPLIGEKALKVRLLVINASDAVIFYVVSTAKADTLPFVRDKIVDSFSNRAEALYSWFCKKAGVLYKR